MSAKTACAIGRLAEPSGSAQSLVTGADPTGRFLLGRGYPASEESYVRYPVIWDRGVMIRVEMPGDDQVLHDANSSGLAVGASYDPQSWQLLTPWVYRNGVLSALPGVASGEALAVNERGEIAGNSGGRPIRWPVHGKGPVYLPVPDGAVGAEARDIDEDGTVVGSYFDAEFVSHAYAWLPDGTGRELSPSAGSRAFNIRNGWVAGTRPADGAGPTQARWQLATGREQTFPQFQTVYAVNRHGWLAGSDPDGRALLLTDRQIRLPGLAVHHDPFGDYATALSDDGRRVGGQALDKRGAIRAVRWTCG